MSAMAGRSQTHQVPFFTDVPWVMTSEHQQWRLAVRQFAKEVLAPGVADRWSKHHFECDLIPQLGELGVFGLRLPEKVGGSDADLTSLCVALEELARVDTSSAVTVASQAMSLVILHQLASPEISAEIVPPAVRGEYLIGFAMTEATGGSDVAAMRTRAVRDGSDWVINGSKQFITNSGTLISRYVVLFALTGDETAGRPEISAFLIPMDTPGITVGGSYDKMGMRASDTHPLFFDDVRLPADALIGEKGRGLSQGLGTLTWARLPVAAQATGLAQGCLDETLRWLHEREVFGRKLGAHQGVAFKFAEMASRVALARTTCYDACYKVDHGLPYAAESAIAKYMTAELANRVAYDATQLHGGYGFMEDYAVTRFYQDARILTIGEGAAEIQKMIIAKVAGLPVTY